jgi:hypothetical protein
MCAPIQVHREILVDSMLSLLAFPGYTATGLAKILVIPE